MDDKILKFRMATISMWLVLLQAIFLSGWTMEACFLISGDV